MNRWDTIFSEGKKFTPLNEIFLEHLLEAIEKQTRPISKEVIDLGCGDGDALIQFAKRGFKVIGVDFSEVALRKSRQALENAKISSVGLRLIDLDDLHIQEKADIIFCKLTYAFIKNKEKFLENVKNLMKERSTFILITPVLHKGVEYTKEDKPGIAVDFEDTNKLLCQHFDSIEIFHHDYFGARGDVTTFLCFLQ